MARITCGHCGITHPNVDEVRICWADEAQAHFDYVNDPDRAYERFLETDERYRAEVDEDERRAMAFI